MTGEAILAVSVTYGAASFATTQTVVNEGAGDAPAPSDRFQREAVRMLVVLLAAATGAMVASRQSADPAAVSPLDVVMLGFVTAGLSLAAVTGLRATQRVSDLSFALGAAPLVVVVFVKMLESGWFSIGAGLLCALPFAIAGAFFPRPSSTDDAMYAGLVGAVLSLFPGMVVLFLGSLAAIGIGRLREVPSAGIRFAPYVAAFGMLGLLVLISLT